MKVLVVLPVAEALSVAQVLRAVRNVGEKTGDFPPDTMRNITLAGARISDAITRQTTPRSLVSHED